MDYIIVAFRTRAHTLKFQNFLSKSGIWSQIINTPKQAGVGCGLSVKVSPVNFQTVKRAVRMSGLSSFAGFFAVKTVAGKTVVKSI